MNQISKFSPITTDLYTVIAVVIPCYKVSKHILGVIKRIGPEVQLIYIVDDACPERTADLVKQECHDPRVRILRHEKNRGVGAAVMTGYQAAMGDGASVIVKVDGDGQMDPSLIFDFVAPILNNEADYTKGNRFFDPDDVKTMPTTRILGNAILSFISKMSSGYWNIFDPTNGYTAISADMVRYLPETKISKRFFFESDMLFRLNILKAKVIDIPMKAKYGDEVSNLRISRVLFDFGSKHFRNFIKRICYNYFLRDLSLASIQLILGLFLLFFGIAFGSWQWYRSIQTDVLASAGTVMLSALPIIIGVQFLIGFLAYDIASVPSSMRSRRFPHITKKKVSDS
ncbi:MAG: glycosyltransferase family 2 protein [Gammaproteobacteria bacterium]|nr:glycosyltransferase family 2 protein [Gammaproteobacteria bacterium]